jgi:hypothetical protein
MQYAILRHDKLFPGFGYVVTQHRTLRTALKAYRPYLTTNSHLLYRTGGFIAQGSLVAIRDTQIVQVDAP